MSGGKSGAAVTLAVASALVLLAARPRPARPQSGTDANLTSLVEAERAFSRTCEEKGIREAFLAFLAEKAVVFRPGPVEARPAYERMSPGDPAVLTWRPEVAEVSAGGDLGYTSGPYQYRESRDKGTPADFGHYVSVWEKQADGCWKVLVDIGIDHGPPEKEPGGVTLVPPSGRPVTVAAEARKAISADLSGQAGALYEAIVKSGFRQAYAAFGTDDLRILKPKRFPASGAAGARDLFSPDEGKVIGTGRFVGRPHLDFKADFKTHCAATGDLGVVHGTTGLTVGRERSDRASVVWIWRRKPGNAWKLCLAVQLPVPSTARS